MPIVQKKPERISPNKGKDINLPLKGLPERFPTGRKASHPAGLPESLRERLIKSEGLTTGTMHVDDIPYLEQYLHPEYEVLERQKLRPTKNPRGTDNLEFFRPNREETEVYDQKDIDKLSSDFRGNEGQKQEAIKKLTKQPAVALNLQGLGNITSSSGKDYDSIYDTWDFNTDTPLIRANTPGPKNIIERVPENIARSIMSKVGKPYHVYERIPKGSYGIIKDSDAIQPSTRFRDINLPKKKK